MSSYSFSITDHNGVIQEFTLADGDRKGDVIVHTRLKENIDDMINDAKAQRSAGRQMFGKGTQTSMYKMGQLSNLEAYNLMRQGIFFDDAALRRWLADRDNEHHRVVDSINKKRFGNLRRTQK